jgi:hypothetical protein
MVVPMTSSFLKGFFVIEKIDMEVEEMFGLFLKSCLSSFFRRQLIFSSNFFKTL